RVDDKGPPDIAQMVVGSPGSERAFLILPGVQQPEDVSLDGRRLVYLQDAATTADIWLASLEGDPQPKPWLRSPFNERNPRFSPDGSRFLVITPVEKSPESPIRVILNWDSVLKKER